MSDLRQIIHSDHCRVILYIYIYITADEVVGLEEDLAEARGAEGVVLEVEPASTMQ